MILGVPHINMGHYLLLIWGILWQNIDLMRIKLNIKSSKCNDIINSIKNIINIIIKSSMTKYLKKYILNWMIYSLL
jgi:hypothetical protein